MELGNMIFGNSRGEIKLPRKPSFEGPWSELCETLKISMYGHAEPGCPLPETDFGDLENDVFRIRAYDWNAECDCGAEDALEKWTNLNPHDLNCYQEELDRRKIAKGWFRTKYGFLENDDPVSYSAKKRVEDEITRSLCKERRLPYPNGCMVHCDCGRDERYDAEWERIGGHKSECRLVQPNFLYKPTGFNIHWYKYPFRDSYMTPGITPKEWREIVRHCIDSASKNG